MTSADLRQNRNVFCKGPLLRAHTEQAKIHPEVHNAGATGVAQR